MASEPTDYVKLPIRQFPPKALRETSEGRYWKSFRCIASEKSPAGVTHLSFCASAPHDLAATSSMRVRIYDGRSLSKKRTLTRFKDVAYSAEFRSDGALLVAGCADGTVRALDPTSRVVLRSLRGHRGPVRAVSCDPRSPSTVASGGDDGTVRLWDLGADREIGRLVAHGEYVRALAPHPLAASTWISGGYDGTVLVWDARASAETPVASYSTRERGDDDGIGRDDDVMVDAAGADDASDSDGEPVADAAVLSGVTLGPNGELLGPDGAIVDPAALLANGGAHAGNATDAPSSSSSSSSFTCSVSARYAAGEPVEALAVFPAGTLLAAAAGPRALVWDLVAGPGRAPLASLASHAKTVTSLALAPLDLSATSLGGRGDGDRVPPSASASAPVRLLAGSLDGYVKVYDASRAFSLSSAIAHGAPVLALAVSPDGATFAVGGADGSLAVRRRGAGKGIAGNGAVDDDDEQALLMALERETGQAGGASTGDASGPLSASSARPSRPLTSSSRLFFSRGQSSRPLPSDLVVPSSGRKGARPSAVDAALRRFRHAEALDAALATGRAAVVASVLEELAQRGALRAALRDRPADDLVPLLRFVRRAVADERYAALAMDAAETLLAARPDLAAEGDEARDEVDKLRHAVRDEMRAQERLARVQGTLEAILAAAGGI